MRKTAPLGILDGGPGSQVHEGCPELMEAVLRVKPRFHIFGHVHAGYGTFSTKSTFFVNAALCSKLGDLDKNPIIVPFSRQAVTLAEI